MIKKLLVSATVAMALAGCQAATEPPTASPTPPPPVITTRISPTTAVDSARTPTIPPSPTHDPYAGFTISDLAARTYGGGELTVSRWEEVGSSFRRGFFEYPSDGLQIHGFLNEPSGQGPFPVVVLLHGYINPSEYEMLAYTTRYADRLAHAGFFVLHPNYRNYPPSEVGPNPFRIGYAIDVLNLIAVLRGSAGEPGPLEMADEGSIGLFGHSMGGGIAIRVMTVDQGIDAALLYGSMSADEQRNFEKILEWSGGRTGWEEIHAPAEDLERISPIYHLDRVQAAVSVHHGTGDLVVPPAWSEELCQQLTAREVAVACFQYQDQPHTFYGEGEDVLMRRAISFFKQELD
ncbi:MAG: alpha/beta hydrolase family protein [Anaerolineales bacterium]